MCKLDVVEKFVSINGEGTKAGQALQYLFASRDAIWHVNIVIHSGRIRQMRLHSR